MSDEKGPEVWAPVPFRFTARTPEGKEIAYAVIPMPAPMQSAEDRRAAPAGAFIQSFTATSAENPQPSTEMQAAPGEEIYLEWNVQGETKELILACEQWKDSAWTKLSEGPADPKAIFTVMNLPARASGKTETQLRYTLRIGAQGAEKEIRIGLRGMDVTPEYLSLQQIIDELKEAKQQHPDFKLAITASGGGARGAWEAGAAEALFRALRMAGIQPAILAGTSAGALVATGLFVDSIYPQDLGLAKEGLLTQQAVLWRDLARGADGIKASDKIGKDRGLILRWLTNEEESGFQRLGDDCNKIGDMVRKYFEVQGSLTIAFAHFPSLQGAIGDYIVHKVLDFSHSGLQPDPTVLAHSQKLADDVDKFKKANFGEQLGLAPAIAGDLVQAAGDGLLTVFNGVADVIGNIERRAVRFAKDVEAFVHEVDHAVRVLGKDAGALVSSQQDLGKSIRDIAWLLALATVNKDHVLENAGIHELLRAFMAKCFDLTHGPNSAGTDPLWQRIVPDWLALDDAPQLFLTATNLTAARLTVFAAARKQAKNGAPGAQDGLKHLAGIEALTRQGIWTVDIGDQFQPTDQWFENLLNVADPKMKQDALIKAALTSAALPFAFPVQHWNLSRKVGPLVERISHDFVDGGVVDNSPIDVAVLAGATHVISLEMTPLLLHAWSYAGWGRPEGDSQSIPVDRNFLNVGTDSFLTSMDGALLRNIENLVEEQRGVQIYRLAPLAPRTVERKKAPDASVERVTVSPDVINFDGVFDANRQLQVSLEDWIMQGYIDGASLDAASVANDPVLKKYARHTKPGAVPIGNLYWRATTQALPDDKPPNAVLPFDLFDTGMTLRAAGVPSGHQA